MIGRTIGAYRVEALLGQGGMGEVYRAVDTLLDRPVAIKALRADVANPQHVERFRHEARTLGRLLHPNIATLYTLLPDDDDLYMVMEFVEGETFEALLAREHRLPADRALALFDQALRGIEHAHRGGVIHRDVKPANFMLTPSGTVKVMDFGIARLVGTSRLTQANHAIGTAEYMAPEQVRAREVDARTDVYALGVLLFELVTGRVPFDAASSFETMQAHLQTPPPPPRQWARDLPPAVEGAILTALAKEPEARHASVAAFRAALAGEAAPSPPSVRPTGVPPSPPRADEPAVLPPRRRRAPRTRIGTRRSLPARARDAAGGVMSWSRRTGARVAGALRTRGGAALATGLAAVTLAAGVWAVRPAPPSASNAARAAAVASEPSRPAGPLALSAADATETPDASETPGAAPATTAPAATDEPPPRAAPDASPPPRPDPAPPPARPEPAPRTPERRALPPAPAPEATPPSGTVRVLVRPFGDVYVDGVRRARETNAPVLTDLPPGSYEVRATHPVFGELRERVQIRAGRTAEVQLRFATPAEVTVVSTPPNAEILLDGAPTGRYTPATVTIPPGRHVVSVVREGAESRPQTVTVRASGAPSRLSFTL